MDVDKPAEARPELRVLNFSAKFLSTRQAAVSNLQGRGWGWRPGPNPPGEGADLMGCLRSAGLAPAFPGAQ